MPATTRPGRLVPNPYRSVTGSSRGLPKLPPPVAAGLDEPRPLDREDDERDVLFDGIRVNEGGEGHLAFRIHDSNVERNVGDGVELDETGEGDVISSVERTDFLTNGPQPQNEDDPEDNFDIRASATCGPPSRG